MEFKLWLLYCCYCLKHNIYPPTFGEFIAGKTEGIKPFVDHGANI